MPVESLHDAALVVQGACQAMERLADEVRPLLDPYLVESTRLSMQMDAGPFDRYMEECGMNALYEQLVRLGDLSEFVENYLQEHQHEAYLAAKRSA